MARDTLELGEATAKLADLTYVNDHDTGIRRTGGRRGAAYFAPDGWPLRDEATLARASAGW